MALTDTIARTDSKQFILEMENHNPRAKRWVFTVVNYTQDDEELIRIFGSSSCKYLIAGRETAPTTGMRHLQCYMMLNDLWYQRSILAMMKRNDGSCMINFIQPAKGTTEQNYKYCKKEGDFFEIGELPSYIVEKAEKEEKTKQIMKDWISLSPEEFEDKWPYQAIHWRRKLMEWEASRATSAGAWDGDLRLKNYWIFGSPGTGKSRWARSQVSCGQCYCKLTNKWWGGFDHRDHRLVLMEDFPQDGKYLAQHMKIWADRYTFTGETKGGQIVVNPGSFFLVVTSNFGIDEVFDGVDCEALKRRFTSIEIRTSEDIRLMSELPKDILKFNKH